MVPSGGWAKDMPLALAVRQVIPANFSLKENGIELAHTVSWSGDLPWPLALQEISRQGRFVSHINWDKKEVSLAPAFVAQKSVAVSSPRSYQPRAYIEPNTVQVQQQQIERPQYQTQYTTIPTNSVAVKKVEHQQILTQDVVPQESTIQESTIQESTIQESTIQESTVQKTIVQEVVQQETQEKSFDIQAGPHSKDSASATSTRIVHVKNDEVVTSENLAMSTSFNEWVLDPGLTLRENVERWAKKVGWHVVWEGADYPIIAPASFSGDFASPTGPLARLISAYESSDQPLVANLTTMDKVVYVKNKFYENPEVDQTSDADIYSELFEDPKN